MEYFINDSYIDKDGNLVFDNEFKNSSIKYDNISKRVGKFGIEILGYYENGMSFGLSDKFMYTRITSLDSEDKVVSEVLNYFF